MLFLKIKKLTLSTELRTVKKLMVKLVNCLLKGKWGNIILINKNIYLLGIKAVSFVKIFSKHSGSITEEKYKNRKVVLFHMLKQPPSTRQ